MVDQIQAQNTGRLCFSMAFIVKCISLFASLGKSKTNKAAAMSNKAFPIARCWIIQKCICKYIHVGVQAFLSKSRQRKDGISGKISSSFMGVKREGVGLCCLILEILRHKERHSTFPFSLCPELSETPDAVQCYAIKHPDFPPTKIGVPRGPIRELRSAPLQPFCKAKISLKRR